MPKKSKKKIQTGRGLASDADAEKNQKKKNQKEGPGQWRRCREKSKKIIKTERGLASEADAEKNPKKKTDSDRDHTVAQGLNNSKDSSDESVGDLGVTWGKGVDADAGAGPASHGPPPSNLTTGLTEVSPTKVTLTAQPFTALDFDYLDPSWLEPASKPPPFDGDDEEESNDSEDDASTGYTGGSDGEGDSEPI
jgi:hypothetical protein